VTGGRGLATMRRVAGRIFATRRGARIFTGNLLAAFGGVSAMVQFFGQLFPGALPHPKIILAGSLCACLGWGVFRAWPRTRVHQRFDYPAMTVTVERGDLFDADSHLVVGFSDTFDTTVDGRGVISSASVQGQLLDRLYHGDKRRLDQELGSALARVPAASAESRQDKARGKLNRYAIGTVAVLGAKPRLVFAVAYSRLGNDLVARSSVEDLWYSLNRLWDAVYRHAEHESVAMPLIGAGLSRLDFLDEESILRLILLSFVTRSRERRLCRDLRIVIRPETLERIDLHEVGAFLRTLGPGSAGP
jgi:hypothetical protein